MRLILSLCRGFGSRFWFGSPFLRVGSDTLEGEQALARLRELTLARRLLVVVGGFNNTERAAEDAFAVICRNLELRGILGETGAYQVAMLVLWPGFDPLSYVVAEYSARHAGRRLRTILQALSPNGIDAEAHSLGNLVVLESNRTGDLAFRNLILTNAAVDDEAIETGQAYATAVAKIAGTCLVVYSRADEVLGGAYRWLGSVPRNLWSLVKTGVGGLGDFALGFSGPEHGTERIPPNVIPLDGTAWCKSHGAARDQMEFYEAWRGVLVSGRPSWRAAATPRS